MNKQRVRDLLTLNLNATWQKVYQGTINALVEDFESWTIATTEFEELSVEHWDVFQLILYIQYQVDNRYSLIEKYQVALNEFKHNYHAAASLSEQTEHVIIMARFLNYSKAACQKIRKKKAMWLDEHAIIDCHTKQLAEIELSIVVMLERLVELLVYLMQHIHANAAASVWKSINLPAFLLPSLRYPSHEGINIAAFKCLRKTLTQLPDEVQNPVSADVTQYIFRLSLDKDINVWKRAEAVGLICQLIPEQAAETIRFLFAPKANTDLFLKARSVQNVLRYFTYDQGQLSAMISLFTQDSSEYVRQCFAKYVTELPFEVRLPLLIKIVQFDASAKVKAQAYLTMLENLPPQKPQVEEVIEWFLYGLKKETDLFLIRTILTALPLAFKKVAHTVDSYFQLFNQCNQRLTELNTSHPITSVRRWASQTREAIWFSRQQRWLTVEQIESLKKLPLEESLLVEDRFEGKKELKYRWLQFIGKDRFGFDVQEKNKRLKVTAGFQFTFRLWRFIYEWLHPATDKRQNHSHTKGRVYYGLNYCATPKVAEQSKTKVPGEAYYINDEVGARSYLPTMDQLISSLDQGWPTKPLCLYTAEGITVIKPPESFWHRLKARTILQWRYAELAELRDWEEGDSQQPDEFIRRMKTLGFSISIKGHLSSTNERYPVDSRVSRFFSWLPLPVVLPSWNDVQNYFYSVYQNTIIQLLVFTLMVTVGFIGKHVMALLSLKKWREKIPLVVGGWGSRGKSGTERLKAALFNAMGLSVLSKTTGCEAMFLYGPPNRPMKELFLFRPYDKATIWEQVFLTKLSGQLNVSVFLWECMGLTPRYIDILQNQWMRDDISTITNCYPDHEDLQGPAGIEIPIVMQRFIPKNGNVLTTEDSMLPILQDAAWEKNARLTSVDWLTIGLLTDDVIERFPYEEHPNNIALVMKLAESLGLREDFALKSMADNVVADLGVLKIYPEAVIRRRRIEFINGMSANERFGAMGNWQRTGLADHHLEKDPNIWTTIVINNRADRIARSKVFASMLINDTRADAYVFIGDNLSGLQTYIEDAWREFEEQWILSDDKTQRQKQIEALALTHRVPVNLATVKQRATAMITGLSIDEALKADWQQQLLDWIEFQNIEQLPQFDASSSQENPIEPDIIDAVHQQVVSDATEVAQMSNWLEKASGDQSSESLKGAFLEWLWARIRCRWLVVENYYSTGNQTIDSIVNHTPPGLLTRMIGMQNIKGTGLDFIYRWQAWDQVYRHCTTLRESRDHYQLEFAAKSLASWQEFGLLEFDFVATCLNEVANRKELQQELLQAELQLITQQLAQQRETIEESLQQGEAKAKWLVALVNALEAFLDAGDAVKRRKQANAIYQAILDNLISYDRASVELAKLTKAQKGGWLMAAIHRRFG